MVDLRLLILKMLQPEVSPLTFVDFAQLAPWTKFKIEENPLRSKVSLVATPLLALSELPSMEQMEPKVSNSYRMRYPILPLVRSACS